MSKDKEKNLNKQENSNMVIETWDVDCDCNLLNDITDDYAFQEDRGTIK